MSSSVILFNKWVLASAKFNFRELLEFMISLERAILTDAALFLTTWHMAFATFMTQMLARCTSTLDSRHNVPMTPRTYT